jgi:hypothetical protein
MSFLGPCARDEDSLDVAVRLRPVINDINSGAVFCFKRQRCRQVWGVVRGARERRSEEEELKSTSAGASARHQHAASLCDRCIAFPIPASHLQFVDVVMRLVQRRGSARTAHAGSVSPGMAGDRFQPRLSLSREVRLNWLTSPELRPPEFHAFARTVRLAPRRSRPPQAAIGYGPLASSFDAAATVAGDRTPQERAGTKRLPDATMILSARSSLLDLQNSLNVCFAINGISRERVHALAGSKRVPLTSG